MQLLDRMVIVHGKTDNFVNVNANLAFQALTKSSGSLVLPIPGDADAFIAAVSSGITVAARSHIQLIWFLSCCARTEPSFGRITSVLSYLIGREYVLCVLDQGKTVTGDFQEAFLQFVEHVHGIGSPPVFFRIARGCILPHLRRSVESETASNWARRFSMRTLLPLIIRHAEVFSDAARWTGVIDELLVAVFDCGRIATAEERDVVAKALVLMMTKSHPNTHIRLLRHFAWQVGRLGKQSWIAMQVLEPYLTVRQSYYGSPDGDLFGVSTFDGVSVLQALLCRLMSAVTRNFAVHGARISTKQLRVATRCLGAIAAAIPTSAPTRDLVESNNWILDEEDTFEGRYVPRPTDSSLELPAELLPAVELLAERSHELWAAQRYRDGWRLGGARDNVKLLHPLLRPWSTLSAAERLQSQRSAEQLLKSLINLDISVVPPLVTRGQRKSSVTAVVLPAAPQHTALADTGSGRRKSRRLAARTVAGDTGSAVMPEGAANAATATAATAAAEWVPNPVNVAAVNLDPGVLAVRELLATDLHDVWALDASKAAGFVPEDCPDYAPYSKLSEARRQDARKAITSSLKFLVWHGYMLSEASQRVAGGDDSRPFVEHFLAFLVARVHCRRDHGRLCLDNREPISLPDDESARCFLTEVVLPMVKGYVTSRSDYLSCKSLSMSEESSPAEQSLVAELMMKLFALSRQEQLSSYQTIISATLRAVTQAASFRSAAQAPLLVTVLEELALAGRHAADAYLSRRPSRPSAAYRSFYFETCLPFTSDVLLVHCQSPGCQDLGTEVHRWLRDLRVSLEQLAFGESEVVSLSWAFLRPLQSCLFSLWRSGAGIEDRERSRGWWPAVISLVQVEQESRFASHLSRLVRECAEAVPPRSVAFLASIVVGFCEGGGEVEEDQVISACLALLRSQCRMMASELTGNASDLLDALAVYSTPLLSRLDAGSADGLLRGELQLVVQLGSAVEAAAELEPTTDTPGTELDQRRRRVQRLLLLFSRLYKIFLALWPANASDGAKSILAAGLGVFRSILHSYRLRQAAVVLSLLPWIAEARAATVSSCERIFSSHEVELARALASKHGHHGTSSEAAFRHSLMEEVARLYQGHDLAQHVSMLADLACNLAADRHARDHHGDSVKSSGWKRILTAQTKQGIIMRLKMIPLFKSHARSPAMTTNNFANVYVNRPMVRAVAHDAAAGTDVSILVNDEALASETWRSAAPLQQLAAKLRAVFGTPRFFDRDDVDGVAIFVNYGRLLLQYCRDPPPGDAADAAARSSFLQECGVADGVVKCLCQGRGHKTPAVVVAVDLTIALLEHHLLFQQELLDSVNRYGRLFGECVLRLLAQCKVPYLHPRAHDSEHGAGGPSYGDWTAIYGGDAHFAYQLLRMLQLMCEGHNPAMQAFMRQQSQYGRSTNLVSAVAGYALQLQEAGNDVLAAGYLRGTSAGGDSSHVLDGIVRLATQCFRTLSEFTQGPCQENQASLTTDLFMDVVSGFLTFFAEWIGSLRVGLQHLYAANALSELFILLQAMSEGHSIGSEAVARVAMLMCEEKHSLASISAWLVGRHDDKRMVEQARDTFRLCDGNGDGWIDIVEYRRLERERGSLEDHQVHALIGKMIFNREGKVNLEEFLRPFQEDAETYAADMQLCMLLRQLEELAERTVRGRLQDVMEAPDIKALLELHLDDLGTVEIVGKTGCIEKVFFPIHKALQVKWPDAMLFRWAEFFQGVERDNHKQKMAEFIGCCQATIFTIKYLRSIGVALTDEEEAERPHELARSPTPWFLNAAAFLARWQHLLTRLVMLFVVIINVLLLLQRRQDVVIDPRHSFVLETYVEVTLWAFGVLHTFASLVQVVGSLFVQGPVIIFDREKLIAQAMYRQQQRAPPDAGPTFSWWDAYVTQGIEPARFRVGRLFEHVVRLHGSTFRYYLWAAATMALNNELLLRVFYLVFSLLGSYFSPFWYCFLIIDIALQSQVLVNVLRSVTYNGRQLLFSMMFTGCVVYIYTVVAFNYFTPFYQLDNVSYCDSMWSCYAFHLNVGLRSGGGIGDAIEQPQGDMEVERFVFDLTFFFFVIVILLAIVQGQIIDTFSELRQKQADIKEDDAAR